MRGMFVIFVGEMNNPFDYIPDKECEEAFSELSRKLDALKGSVLPEDINFSRELESGKMLGTLIAVDNSGNKHTLYAFSGQLGDGGFYREGFVGPVFDYLQPDGYFKTKEADIARQNIIIAQFENGPLTEIKRKYEDAKECMDTLLADCKEHCQNSKSDRDQRRMSGNLDDAEIAAMIRQSQFEKAEFHRLKKRLAADIDPLAINLRNAQAHLDMLKEKRSNDSANLQDWLFSNFRILNARGESKSLSEIFADTAMKIPPSGAGECCAPKLLQAAYLRGWHPISIAEYWYGKSNSGEVRKHGEYYPACRGKCLPVLTWMLEGLDIVPPLDGEHNRSKTQNPEIIYENEWFCVINKPSGMLSVPGKGESISVQSWLEYHYGGEREVKVAHRLDQDTSGLLIATFGNKSFKLMQSLFATRKIRKTYIALLEGDFAIKNIPLKGRVELPLSPDWLDRPRQCVDIASGKEAVTDYEFIETRNGRSRVIFHPLTGRTHQLRVHSASDMGLGMPIAGDRLYGTHKLTRDERLHLHAHRIEFTFQTDGNHYAFESPVPF